MKIDLFDCSNILGLIINCESGITYTNQMHGVCCRHPEIQGVYIPISNKTLLNILEGKLINYSLGLTEKIADELDDLFEIYFKNFVIRVNREKLDKSGEAWVYVTFQEQKESDLFKGFEKEGWNRGVLTW